MKAQTVTEFLAKQTPSYLACLRREQLLERLQKTQQLLLTPIDIVTIAYCGMSEQQLHSHVERYEEIVAQQSTR